MSKIFDQEALIDSVARTFADCLDIMQAKNSDYAKEKTDAFSNFRSALLIGVDPKRAILVRVLDKLSRVSNLIEKDAAVKDESVEDTIKDIINYMGILKALIESEE